MQIPTFDLKQLKALIALCRKQGVESIEIGDIKVKLKDIPTQVPNKRRTKNTIQNSTQDPNVPSEGALSNEELLFWSTGVVGNDALPGVTGD